MVSLYVLLSMGLLSIIIRNSNSIISGIISGADLGILRGGGGGSGPEFFEGGLGSRSAGIFIY